MAFRPGYYNEVFDAEGNPREHYERLLENLEGSGGAEERAREKLEELGATFVPPGSGEQDEIFSVDWIPRIVPADHWEKISAGLLQRGKAINAWLRDLYHGAQDVVPDEVVHSSFFYRRDPVPEDPFPVRVYGPDIVHLGDGEYTLLEDNVRMPAGIAYAEALRWAGREAMGERFAGYRMAEGHEEYYAMLRKSLEAATGSDEPTIAVFTRGHEDAAFFEHRRIAEACGFLLLTLDDCHVEGGEVRTRAAGRRLDVMYRRFEEDHLAGLPGLEEVYNRGAVNFENALGVGVADDKAVFPYVHEMVRRYLGEEPILRGAATYSLADEEPRKEALERLGELVLKPREGYGGRGLLMGPEASRQELDEARRRVEANPTAFVAQDLLELSTHVVPGGPQGYEEVFIDLRTLALPAVDYVMPGGLTRVARPGTRVVNVSAGGSTKDTWVLVG